MKKINFSILFSFLVSSLYSQLVVINQIVHTESSTIASTSQVNEYPSNCLLDFNVNLKYYLIFNNNLPDPYDYENFALQVDIKTTGGDLIKTVDGFFEFDPNKSFEESWHVRLSFDEIGSYDLTFKTTGGASCLFCPTIPIEIKNLPASCNYMSKLNFSSNNFMENKEGEPFFSFGAYLGILKGVDGAHHSTFESYDDYNSNNTRESLREIVEEWATYGGNTFKFQLSPDHSLDIEWDKVGDYSDTWERQLDLDYMVELSSQNGIYLILSLFVNDREGHWFDGKISNSYSGTRPYNPYRYFLHQKYGWDWNDESNDKEELVKLFTDPESIEFQKRKIRYVNARWGYSNTVIGYELHNELNPGYYWYLDENIAGIMGTWANELACFVKNELNPEKIVSLSTAHTPESLSLTNSSCIDFEYPHFGDWANMAQRNASYIKNLVTEKWAQNNGKPIIAGDWGFSGLENNSGGNCQPWENTKNKMHNALWSSSFTGAFGACYPFYSGSDIFAFGNQAWQTPTKGVHHFRPLSDFMKNENLNDGTWTPIANKPEWNYSKDDDYENYNPQSSGGNTWYYSSRLTPWVLGDSDFGYDPNGNGKKAWLGSNLLEHFTGTSSNPKVTTTDNEDIELFALKNDNKIIGWVHNKDYNWKNIPNGVAGTPSCFNNMPLWVLKYFTPDYDYLSPIPIVEDETFTIYGVFDGKYEIEWWNTFGNEMDFHHHNPDGSFSRGVSDSWEGVDVDGDGIADDGGVFSSPEFEEYNQVSYANNGNITFKIPPLKEINLSQSSIFAPDYGFKIKKTDGSVSCPDISKSVHDIVAVKNLESKDPCSYNIYALGGSGDEYVWRLQTDLPVVTDLPIVTEEKVLKDVILSSESYTDICVQSRNSCSESEEYCITLPPCKGGLILEFNIYPNPADSKINIDKNDNYDLSFQIYNIKGTPMMEKIGANKQEILSIDISSFPDGTYIIIGENGKVEAKRETFIKSSKGDINTVIPK